MEDPAADPELVPLEVEVWLPWLATGTGRAPSTLAAYRRDARRWWAWLRRTAPAGNGSGDGDGGEAGGGAPALAEVGTGTVEAYVAELRGSDLAPATVARAVVAVRSLHRFLADEGRAPADPGAEVATPRVPAGLPKALS